MTKIETSPKEQNNTDIINEIEENAHHPNWEELCKLFPNKYQAEDKPAEYLPDNNLYVFEYGNKAVQLIISSDPYTIDDNMDIPIYFAIAHIQNQSDKKPKKEQTTHIYEAIKKKLEKISLIEDNKLIRYIFTTENHKMALWAINEGEQIFKWKDNIRIIINKLDDSSFKSQSITVEDFLAMTEEERNSLDIKVTCDADILPINTSKKKLSKI